jgi:hypothetical protein
MSRRRQELELVLSEGWGVRVESRDGFGIW